MTTALLSCFALFVIGLACLLVRRVPVQASGRYTRPVRRVVTSIVVIL